jgi:drug/metabolite transporter (DMT)-like permease
MTPSADTGSTQAHALRGALFALAGAFLFACMDTSIKYLAALYPAPVIVGVRYVVLVLLMLAVLAPTQGMGLVRTRRTGMALLRAGCLASGSLFFALALQRLPVAEATAILFLSPLIVVVLARPVLGERVGALGWGATLAGFAGVLLLVRPGASLEAGGIMLAGAAAVATAMYQLLSRVLASTETTLALLFYTALVGAIAFGPAAAWLWQGPVPAPLLCALFVAVGVLGGLGHFLFTAAHRLAAASTLAPVLYAQLVWAGMLGWLAFGHVPDAASIAGMGVIAGAGALAAIRSRLAARALERASEA